MISLSATNDKFFVTSNGLRVSALQIPAAPFVHLTLTLGRGMAEEAPGEYGLFSLLATLCGRGCGPWDRAEFARETDGRGANLQFYPGRDFFTLEFWVLPGDLMWALSVLRRVVWEPRLSEEEVEVAVEEHTLQLLARPDEKKSCLYDAARREFFAAGHPYGRPLLGEPNDLGQADQAMLRRFHQRLVARVPAALCVTGGFREEDLEQGLSDWFQDLELGTDLFWRALPGQALRSEARRVLAIPFPVEQAEVLISLPAPARSHPDYRLSVFCNEVFGGAFLSRLTRAIRMREGMAYSADSRLATGAQAGVLWIALQTDRHKLSQALATVRACLDELRQDELGAAEFQHFKEFVTSSMPFDYDALADLTSRRLEQILFDEPWDLESRRSLFEQEVTLAAANQGFRTLLNPERAVVTVLGQGLDEGMACAFHEGKRMESSVPLSMIRPPALPQAIPPGEAELVRSHAQGSLYRLACGVHLLTLPRNELASISLQVWTMTGAMDESPGGTGLSHLLEHLMFRGTERFPDGEFDTILAQRGGLNNAFTTEDFTVYLDYVTPEGLAEALLLEVDRWRHLDISQELFETELSVVLEERSVRVDCSPLGQAYEKLQHLAFGSHPYGHPVIGWREDLENLSLEQMQRHYQIASGPDKMLVVVAGGCPSFDAVQIVNRTFSSVDWATPRGPEWPVIASTDPVPLLQAQSLELRERSGYSYLLAAYRFPREGHPDYEACELLSRVLGEGDSSRLYDHFVREQREVMEVWTTYESQSRDHPLLVLGLTNAGELAPGLEARLGAYLASLSSKISQDELEKARTTWLAEEAFGTDELEDWALGIAGRVVLLPWDQVWSQEDRLRAVTLQDVRRVADLYLKPEGMVSVLLHGEKEETEE